MPGDAGVTVVTTLVCFYFLHARLRRVERPAFPAPSEFQMALHSANLAQIMQRDRRGVRVSPSLRALAKQSILARLRKLDCFASARNDGVEERGQRIAGPSTVSPSCPALCRASTFFLRSVGSTWMAGTSPAMTQEGSRRSGHWFRHCEERMRRGNPAFLAGPRWIASLALAMTRKQW